MKQFLAIALTLVLTGCSSPATAPPSPGHKLLGTGIESVIEKLGPPEQITETSAGKHYRWQRHERVESSSYGNYKRSVEASCIFELTVDKAGLIKATSRAGHDQVCMYFDDKLS
ncbi:hypothetical protein [Porticoccus sp.]